jgi:hypothetical protein
MKNKIVKFFVLFGIFSAFLFATPALAQNGSLSVSPLSVPESSPLVDITINTGAGYSMWFCYDPAGAYQDNNNINQNNYSLNSGLNGNCLGTYSTGNVHFLLLYTLASDFATTWRNYTTAKNGNAYDGYDFDVNVYTEGTPSPTPSASPSPSPTPSGTPSPHAGVIISGLDNDKTLPILASVGTLTSDLWKYLALVMGIPLAFYIISQAVGIVDMKPKKRQ